MEQRKIRNLSDNAKIIKITGQNTGPFDGVDCELVITKIRSVFTIRHLIMRAFSQ